MREAGLWTRDPDAYYTQGDFLSFDLTPPRQLVADVSGGLIARHMRVAAFYRHSVRNALALARVLNRTLIVPPFQCYCDRWWGNVLPTCLIPGARAPPPPMGTRYHLRPTPCWFSTSALTNLPSLFPALPAGSDQTIPFQCPMDHLFFLPNWDTRVQWREHSFLTNPRVPDAVRSSRCVCRFTSLNSPAAVCTSLTSLPHPPATLRLGSLAELATGPSVRVHAHHSAMVQVVPAITARAAAATLDDNSTVLLAAGASDVEVVGALRAVAGVRVLHFASTVFAFCRFERDDENVAFDTLMETVLKAEVRDPTSPLRRTNTLPPSSPAGLFLRPQPPPPPPRRRPS